MTSQRTRRQHVVSAFYLRGFANEAEQLRCAPRDGRPEFTVSVGDASVHSNFYSIVSQDGAKDDTLESWLAEVEAGAAPVLRSILAGEALPPVGDDRLALSGWIAAQYLRGEAQRTMLSQAHELIGAVTSQQLGDVAVEAIQSVIDNAPSAGQTDPKVHAWVIRELMPRLAAWIMASPWHVTTFVDEPLVTGDHPVCLIPNQGAPASANLAFATAMGLAIPLARYTGLLAVTSAAWREQPDFRGSGTAQDARFLNLTTMLAARRQVYRNPDDQLPEPMTSFPSPQTQEIAFEVIQRTPNT